MYLNVAEFGPGTFGVLAASRHAFLREPGELTPHVRRRPWSRCCRVPTRMSAASPSEYVLRRTREIQQAVAQLGGAGYLSGL